MSRQEFCHKCSERHNCHEVYRQLGKVEGPSVVFKVVVAFLLPLMVFIAALAVFEKILAGVVNTEQLQTALVFLLAALVTFAFILIIKAINKQFSGQR